MNSINGLFRMSV